MRRKTPEVMTVSDLRAYLRTNYYAAKALMTSGTLPANQVNEHGDWRVLKSDVDEWLRAGRKTQTND